MDAMRAAPVPEPETGSVRAPSAQRQDGGVRRIR